MDTPHQQPPLTKCPKCNGLMLPSNDAHGPYLRCFQCGTLIELTDQDGRLDPRPPASPEWSQEANLPTDDAYTCDEAPRCTECPLPFCKFEVKGYDHARIFQEKHRRILDTIESEDLSIAEAAARFNLSKRTIFRIKAWGRRQPNPQQETI